MRHGSYAGAQSHYRAGERPCDLCRGAAAEYARIYRRHGPQRVKDRTTFRIRHYLETAALDDEPTDLKAILDGVTGRRETVRRTVYRMVDRGDIVCDTDTKCYTVSGSEEG